jgi:hypothetical protein
MSMKNSLVQQGFYWNGKKEKLKITEFFPMQTIESRISFQSVAYLLKRNVTTDRESRA